MVNAKEPTHQCRKRKGIRKRSVCWRYACIVEGNSQRSIARILKISVQSVSNWIETYIAKLPSAPKPQKPKVAELDELYTFLKQKKTRSTF